MFGMFSIDAAQGMLDQKTTNDTRRVQIAKAFEDFRRDNPYATALDLQNFTDSLVGNDFFLRPGNATGAALEQIAADNAIKRNIRDRQRAIDSMNQDTALSDQIMQKFEINFRNTGDATQAFNDVKNEFSQLGPGDPSLDAVINNALGTLESQKDSIAQNIVFKGLGELETTIKGQVSAGQGSDAIYGSLPGFLQGDVAEGYIQNLVSGADASFRRLGFEQVNTFLTNPKIADAVGQGDYDVLRNMMGEREFDRLNVGPNGEKNFLIDYANNILRSQRLNKWADKTASASSAGLEYGRQMMETRQAENATVFGYIANITGSNQEYAEAAISQIMGEFIIEPSAYPAINKLVQDGGYSSSQELVDAINASVPKGGLIPKYDYQNQMAQRYLATQNLGGEAPQTFREFYKANLGQDGIIPTNVTDTIKASERIKGDTADLYGGTNQFGLPTASSFKQHATDIDTAIRQQALLLQQLDRTRRTMANPSMFLPDERGTVDGEDVSPQTVGSAADQQIANEMQKIQNNIKALQDKKNAVLKQGRALSSTNRSLSSVDDIEINNAAKAMVKYSNNQRNNPLRNGRSAMQLALRYAAMMGLKNADPRGINPTVEQQELANKLLNAIR